MTYEIKTKINYLDMPSGFDDALLLGGAAAGFFGGGDAGDGRTDEERCFGGKITGLQRDLLTQEHRLNTRTEDLRFGGLQLQNQLCGQAGQRGQFG